MKGFDKHGTVLSRTYFKASVYTSVLTLQQVHLSMIVAVWVFYPHPVLRGGFVRADEREGLININHQNASSWPTDVQSFVRGIKLLVADLAPL